MRMIVAMVLALASGYARAATHEFALQPAQLAHLDELAVGQGLVIDDFPDGFGGSASVRFERIDIYARGARLIAKGADGEHEVPRSARIELLGADASGNLRLQLGFDPGFTAVRGAGSSPGGAFAIMMRKDAGGTRLLSMPTDESLPAGVTPEVVPSEDGLPSGQPMPLILPLADDVRSATATPRGAVVAVDVDHALLVNRFGGTGAANVAAATNWIADLFATMDVMYVRDLNVMLQQGTTIFRTSSTPYVIAVDTAANNTDLANFGTYWHANEAGVPRDFTALLSGQMTGGFNASGIAWINSYCNTASNGGSYSVNKVFTSPNVPVDISARIVGHEIGHNFGAYHTHCTNVTTGVAPTGASTIDHCVSGATVGATPCYSGPVSCPSSGPGAPAGTLMSYCNTIQCGSNHQNLLQFHPAQIGTLSTLIALNTPSCLSTNADLIFRGGFD